MGETMTNNPTIDGVSLLPCPCCGSKELSIRYHSPQANWIQCEDCESESRAFDSKTALLTHWNTRVAPPEVAALQSTIAQLQARIAELDSGRGEQSAPFYISIEDWNLLVRGDIAIANTRVSRAKRGKFTEALFTALPAPVVVVLPERKPAEWRGSSATFASGWNACLDATAALNTIHVGELDPAQRLALARGESFVCGISGDWNTGWTFIDANKTGEGQGVCYAFPPGKWV